MSDSVLQHFRCPEHYVSVSSIEPTATGSGYFKFGQKVLYGRTLSGATAPSPTAELHDLLTDTKVEGGTVFLPFDIEQAMTALRHEVYHTASNGHHPASSISGQLYYLLRPLMPVKVRKDLQKVRLNGWDEIPFPSWPVDHTVDSTLETLLLLSMRAQGLRQIPFIWFWPDGASSCAVMTHDVETTAGRDFCSTLMDINDAFDVKASFQVVPEVRYEVPASYLEEIRRRGFEVNVQDLNHDGHLFRERALFLQRVKKINAYGREYGAEGFRAAVLYRRQEWYDQLQFEYDMSVPNVAHLDPQRGGCCTITPYFVGGMVELPVTMTQDYSLFHILNDHSIDLWKRQSELIRARHGLMNFIIHPDYIIEKAERTTYENLLRYLAELRAEKSVWIPLPRDAASWWRLRSRMRLVSANGGWKIEGDGSERARIAYASEKDGRLEFSFEPNRRPTTM